MKTLLLLFLLVSSCSSSQDISTRVLARGVIYDWKITQMSEPGINGPETAIYFTLNSGVTQNSNGFYIGIVTVDELRLFVDELRSFASYADSLDRQQRYDSFEIFLTAATGKITLTDYKSHYLILTKANAKALATDIEKSINLMNQ